MPLGCDHLLLRHRDCVKEGLHRGLAEAPASLMRPLFIVRAMFSEKTFESRRENLSHPHTYALLLDALNRLPRQRATEVTAEQVHLHSGGQTIVVTVERRPPIRQDQRTNTLRRKLPMHLSPRCGPE